ncbi:GNAT family N-acetyltransferase [Acidobacteria bacterium AB60]|nr:GNAT family N-acetyltransferase [Acidobacteria bacterium AB60]
MTASPGNRSQPFATSGASRYIGVVQYRLYQDGDFPRIYAIENVCFNPPLRFGRQMMRELIAGGNSATWIAEQENAVLGFAIVEWGDDGDGLTAYIPTLEVLPGERRRGIGAELLSRLEASAAQAGAGLIWLHVDAKNEAAIRLYRAAGYEQKGRHEHYYARYRAAEIYAKALTPEDRQPSPDDVET